MLEYEVIKSYKQLEPLQQSRLVRPIPLTSACIRLGDVALVLVDTAFQSLTKDGAMRELSTALLEASIEEDVSSLSFIRLS